MAHSIVVKKEKKRPQNYNRIWYIFQKKGEIFSEIMGTGQKKNSQRTNKKKIVTENLAKKSHINWSL